MCKEDSEQAKMLLLYQLVRMTCMLRQLDMTSFKHAHTFKRHIISKTDPDNHQQCEASSNSAHAAAVEQDSG